jgi:hypothetical protein
LIATLVIVVSGMATYPSHADALLLRTFFPEDFPKIDVLEFSVFPSPAVPPPSDDPAFGLAGLSVVPVTDGVFEVLAIGVDGDVNRSF